MLALALLRGVAQEIICYNWPPVLEDCMLPNTPRLNRQNVFTSHRSSWAFLGSERSCAGGIPQAIDHFTFQPSFSGISEAAPVPSKLPQLASQCLSPPLEHMISHVAGNDDSTAVECAATGLYLLSGPGGMRLVLDAGPLTDPEMM